MGWSWRAAKSGTYGHPYAVIDCETTGLFPGAHHRIIELAILQVGADGQDQAEWHSLINPSRDLGDASIHGIRGIDVIGVPTFSDLVGTVLDRLRGRVIVAHNARFDLGFLEAELDRAGYPVAPLSGGCTMELARRAGLQSRRLSDCCKELGAPAEPAHEALADARACAALLRALLVSRGLDGASLGASPNEPWPSAPLASEAVPRNSRSAVSTDSYLAHLAQSRAEVTSADSSNESGYGELLDRALEDRWLSDDERDDLIRAAEIYGISGRRLEDVHRRYLDSLCDAALADRVVTERELHDLRLVADLLGVDDLHTRLRMPEISSDSTGEGQLSEDLSGKRVCFTGKLLCSIDGEPLTREHAEHLAIAAGLQPQRGVTKKLDILVVADPNTQSGKARKARGYGTRVISEVSFWPMIDVTVE